VREERHAIGTELGEISDQPPRLGAAKRRGNFHRRSFPKRGQRGNDWETITLLCSSACVRESRCHRSILKELIKAQLAESAS
jgi:hypothetical protein